MREWRDERRMMRCNRYNGNVKPGNGNEVKTTWLLVTGRGRGVVWWWRVEDYEGCCFVTEWRQNFCHIPVIIGVLAAYSHCMKVVTGAVTSKLTPFIVPPHSIGDWLNKYWRTFAEHEISTPSWRECKDLICEMISLSMPVTDAWDIDQTWHNIQRLSSEKYCHQLTSVGSCYIVILGSCAGHTRQENQYWYSSPDWVKIEHSHGELLWTMQKQKNNVYWRTMTENISM